MEFLEQVDNFWREGQQGCGEEGEPRMFHAFSHRSGKNVPEGGACGRPPVEPFG